MVVESENFFGRGDMALSHVVPVLGPPAVGKTTLTLALAANPHRRVFRLREHVPFDLLAATTASADQLGWIADDVVESTVGTYIERLASGGQIHTVLLDNFPGTALQTRMLIEVLAAHAPQCAIAPIELVLDERTRRSRATQRRVCHRCERDPIADPRIPASATASNPWKCGRCGSLLHPRRGDAPSLFAARSRRHEGAADAIHEAFAAAGHPVTTLTADRTPDALAGSVEPTLLRSRTS